MNRLKALYIYPLTILSVIITSFLTMVTGILFTPFNKVSDKILFWWGKSVILISGIDVDVRGAENIADIEGGGVILANHQSNFDIPIIFAVIPKRVRFMAKKQLFKIPLFGHALRAVGMISIDREHREQAIKEMDKSLENLKQNVNFAVFPEGTRSLNHDIQNFKKGGFVFAIKTGAPIIPVVISGTFEIMPKQGWSIKPTKVIVNIQEKFDTTGYTVKERNSVLNLIRDKMVEQHKKNLEELGYV